MKRSMLRKRGAAAVELAVTMVLLVPLILYTLFLEDLLQYRLEGQEPTITAGWDYITNDYMRERKDIGGLNRLKFCDHSAAFDSFNKGYDCNGESTGGAGSGEDEGTGGGLEETGGGGMGSHHQAGGAHQCWLAKSDTDAADQVRCSRDVSGGGLAMAVGTAAPAYLVSNWNKGGTITCRDKLGVMNYMLPMKFMEWAGRNSVSKKGRNSAGAGANATFTEIDAKIQSGGDNVVHADKNNSANAWILRQETFAVLADSFALNLADGKPGGEDVDPGKGAPVTSAGAPATYPGFLPGSDTYHPLLDRSGWYYNAYAGDAIKKSDKWFKDQAISGSDGFLNKSIVFGANQDTIGGLGGGDPGSLPVMWSKDVKRPGDSGGYASGWADSRQAQVSGKRSAYPWP